MHCNMHCAYSGFVPKKEMRTQCFIYMHYTLMHIDLYNRNFAQKSRNRCEPILCGSGNSESLHNIVGHCANWEEEKNHCRR